MTRTRLILGAAAATAAAAVLLLGGIFHDSSAASPSPPVASAAPPEALQTGFSPGGSTAASVSELQAKLLRNPNAVTSLDALGLAYQQRARETGDPAYYTKSEQVLNRALRLAPRDLMATSGLGSLALSRHRFAEALTLGRKALAISPTTALNYGITGDALVELGRYPAAFEAFDTMANLKPSLSSYARVSHGLELLGRVPEAIETMRLAVGAAQGQGEPEAWTRFQLGKLYWSIGRFGAAEQQDRAALRVFPGYHYALDALARIEAAKGHNSAAIGLQQQAVDTIPLPQYVAQLGDLYRASGQTQAAKKQYALIGVIERLLVANGVKTDLETALFDADHGIRLPAALALARSARAERASIDGDDVLAWALYRNGRCGEALGHSRQSLRLGTRDALKLFHRGMIERCLGDSQASRSTLREALALNPHFSILWATVARKALK
jgi:tetratricopeptide (TPR) repeat protein